jgi:hypothetical protein
MATARTSPLEAIGESITRIQREGERAVAQFRRDAGRVVAKRGALVVKELRGFEHRLMRALHAATTAQVGRLERRVAALEERLGGRGE